LLKLEYAAEYFMHSSSGAFERIAKL